MIIWASVFWFFALSLIFGVKGFLLGLLLVLFVVFTPPEWYDTY